jgi:hypothetical protein
MSDGSSARHSTPPHLTTTVSHDHLLVPSTLGELQQLEPRFLGNAVPYRQEHNLACTVGIESAPGFWAAVSIVLQYCDSSNINEHAPGDMICYMATSNSPQHGVERIDQIRDSFHQFLNSIG